MAAAIKGKSTTGTPFGTKSSRYLIPCLTNPITVTPINTAAANTNVTMIWLVTVNEYGSIPTILQNKTNINKVKMNGKKTLALEPAVSLIILDIKVKLSSASNCALVGIIFVIFFKISQDRTIFFLAIGIAVGISVMLMMAFKITHPPAGANTIVVMLAQDSFQFLIFPIMVGAITIIIGGVIYNRFILKKNYPLKWL